jgi:hypothetical protein
MPAFFDFGKIVFVFFGVDHVNAGAQHADGRPFEARQAP